MEYTTYAVTAINTPAAYTPHCTSQRLRRVWGHSTGRLPCCVSYQNTSEGSIQGRQARRAMASHHLTEDGSRQARPRHIFPGQPCQQARQWPETRTVTSGDAPPCNVEHAYDRPWYAS